MKKQKKYIVKITPIQACGDNALDLWEKALNSPPNDYEVDSYQAVEGDSSFHRRYIVVYKLIEQHKIDTVLPCGRKFKGEW